jgi:hypothetical protein
MTTNFPLFTVMNIEASLERAPPQLCLSCPFPLAATKPFTRNTFCLKASLVSPAQTRKKFSFQKKFAAVHNFV